MPYLNSNDVIVYPASTRVDYVLDSKLTTEQTMAKIQRQFIDNKAFVINYENDIIELNIMGYNFILKNISNILNNFTYNSVFAKIKLSPQNELICADTLDDASNLKFNGIELVNENIDTTPEVLQVDITESPPNIIYKFYILSKDEHDNWIVPSGSQQLINTSRINTSVFTSNGELDPSQLPLSTNGFDANGKLLSTALPSNEFTTSGSTATLKFTSLPKELFTSVTSAILKIDGGDVTKTI